jgi:hypothetical protein
MIERGWGLMSTLQAAPRAPIYLLGELEKPDANPEQDF